MNKQENQYWDLSSLEKLSVLDEAIYKLCGKFEIDLHKHSCMSRKFPFLEVGKEYYFDMETTMGPVKYKLCKITCIRSGVIFFKTELDEYSEEHHIEEFSIMHYFAEPTEITVAINPRHCEILSRSGKMIVNYTRV